MELTSRRFLVAFVRCWLLFTCRFGCRLRLLLLALFHRAGRRGCWILLLLLRYLFWISFVLVGVLIEQQPDDCSRDHECCESDGWCAETPAQPARGNTTLGSEDLFQRTILNFWLQRRFEAGDLAAEVEKVSAQLLALVTAKQVAFDFACFGADSSPSISDEIFSVKLQFIL